VNPSLDMADAFDGLTEVATLITPAASVRFTSTCVETARKGRFGEGV